MLAYVLFSEGRSCQVFSGAWEKIRSAELFLILQLSQVILDRTKLPKCRQHIVN